VPPRDWEWEMGNGKGKSDSGEVELSFESLFFSGGGRGMVYSFKHERKGDNDYITKLNNNSFLSPSNSNKSNLLINPTQILRPQPAKPGAIPTEPRSTTGPAAPCNGLNLKYLYKIFLFLFIY
jgi:hypothetical protein